MIDEALTAESGNLAEILLDPTVSIVAHLTKLPIPEDASGLTLADLIECDFPGYAPWKITDWDIMQHEDDFMGEAISEPIQFASTGPIIEQLAFGMFVTIQREGGDPVLWQLFRFDESYAFQYLGRPFECQVRIDSCDDSPLPD